ncbi:MAG: 3-dehydroquinate synthase [Pirellulales bacterium]|nr:3-dehydroquinate synthase [Pirellulales bacterium]
MPASRNTAELWGRTSEKSIGTGQYAVNEKNCESTSIDVPFSVPFVHRLRFTRDILGADRRVLGELLEPSGPLPARVQFWLDANVAEAHPALMNQVRSFASEFADRVILTGAPQIVPGGEELKNDIHVLERMLAEFHSADLDRRSYIVVIGGGAVLDTVGFAATMAHRGVRLVRLPTTTLAQADSGIGVKNGVNLFRTKNWLGAFAPPWGVINDAHLLETLTDRDFLAGFAEAVKVAVLKDPGLFEVLCREGSGIRRREMSVCLPIIRRSAELHLDHITHGGDPFEMLEARPLDFGHWSAHKLEVMTDFSLRHGEAVAIGIAIDTVYASLALGLAACDATRVLDCLTRLGFALDHPQLGDSQQLLTGLEEFRQHLGGRLTLTMLRGIGRTFDIHEVDRNLLNEAIRQVRQYARSPCCLGDDAQRGRSPAPWERLNNIRVK